MFITVIFLIVILFFFTVLNIKKRHISVITFYLASLALILFIATIYISKVNYYKFPLRFDYFIYLKLSSLRIPISTLKILYNLSFALFMAASVNTAKQILRLKPILLMLLSIPIVIFILLTDPNILNDFYIHLQNANGIDIMGLSNIVCSVILIAYSLLPFFCLIKYYNKTSFKANKHAAMVLSVCIAAVEIYFYAIFIFGIYKHILFSSVNPIGVPLETFSVSNYLPISIITFFLLTPTVMLLVILKPFNLFSYEYNRNKDIEKNVQSYNRHFISNLHTYKNMLWGTQQQFELIRIAMLAKDYDAVIKYASDGADIANQHVEQIAHTMNAFNQDNTLYEDVDIISCLDNAFEKSPIGSNVTVIKKYQYPHIFTYGSKYMLTEAFYNIIINSLESFQSDNSNPTLSAIVEFEDNVCMIELTDNGCGISKKNLKNIFDPFYSTKSQSDNFGIGLNFVKKIVRAYHGIIIVSSKLNKYTTFQITIPFSTIREEA